MNRENTFNAILNELIEIENIIKRSVDSRTIPGIELDLVLDKMRKVYDSILTAGISQKHELTFTDEIISIEEKTTAPVQRSNKLKEHKNLKENKSDVIEAKPVIKQQIKSKTHVKSKEEKPVSEMPVSTQTHIKTDHKTQVIREREIMADKFPVQTSRHEALTEKIHTHDVSSKYQVTPITDIKKAIGVNDKFLYIRELFDDDVDAFNKTINYLNNTDDFQEAESYLNDNFDWKEDDTVVIKFMELLKRKFITL